ncbi:transmembrane protein 272-like isoform X2 [Neoarius graeffei]|uniref:transmembrane protein 272-like isoform X2 n=1 Tax=Neoarius graeffei TaxID=443677 RepID=UPI00298CD004|nr:transmembrane protein 272-like isoform X2 [Neoarius graeffei]
MEDRALLHNIRQTPKPSLPVLIISKLMAIALPVAQLVIGVLYLEECPCQPLIPIYLLVSGVFAIMLVMLSCLPCTQEGENGGGAISTLCTTWNSLVTLFLFCWFIAGNVWIYSIYEPSYDQHTVQYCAKTLYLFAFWTVTLVYIIIGLIITAGCCIMVCMCLCSRAGISSGLTDDV